LWKWEAPRNVDGPTTLIETPTSLVLGRNGGLDRATLVVLGKGTGQPEQLAGAAPGDPLMLPGRRFTGSPGPLALGGAVLAESAVELRPPAYDIRRMPRPPEIDGELNDWWRGWSAIDLSGPRYVQPIQLDGGRPGRWNGPEDLSAKLYMGWDDKYFYFALD